jgi:PAP2 superfamily
MVPRTEAKVKMNLNLPPYGRLTAGDESTIIRSPIPSFFRHGPRVAIADRIAAKDRFIDDCVRHVRKRYWPEWSGDQWKGAAKGKALLLTEQDFLLLPDCRFMLRNQVDVNGVLLNRTHDECFRSEDSRQDTFKEFRYYSANLLADDLGAFPALFEAGMSNRVGTLTMQLKRRFQRPRPYQVAEIISAEYFSYLDAATPHHPALPAGHCIQGLFGGLHVFHNWSSRKGKFGQEQYDALMQYSIDFGDRRVMAGLHYPSDILISWMVALALVEETVEKEQLQATREFVRKTILRSRLWRLFEDFSALPGNGGGPLHSLISDVRACLIAKRANRVFEWPD